MKYRLKIIIKSFWRTLILPIDVTPAKTQDQLQLSKPWANAHG
jgi:hypothetical protein